MWNNTRALQKRDFDDLMVPIVLPLPQMPTSSSFGSTFMHHDSTHQKLVHLKFILCLIYYH